jgi:hypothetical protein
VWALPPQGSASTNFATSAEGSKPTKKKRLPKLLLI